MLRGEQTQLLSSLKSQFGGDDEVYPDEHLEMIGLELTAGTPGPDPIAQRMLECRSVVTATYLPAWAKKQLMNVRRCYALALFEPAMALCRCFIEASTHAWLQKRGLTGTKGTVVQMGERSLPAALRDVARRGYLHEPIGSRDRDTDPLWKTLLYVAAMLAVCGVAQVRRTGTAGPDAPGAPGLVS
jgi:hypothetical protein